MLFLSNGSMGSLRNFFNPSSLRNGKFSEVVHKLDRRFVNTLSPLATAFNTKPNNALGLEFLKRKRGLFGLEELIEPSGFYLLKENAIAETHTLLKECVSPNRNRKMVEVFDNLSNSLCCVADLAEFIRMVHPDGSFSSAAESSCISIGTLVEQLNTNKELYDALKRTVAEGDRMKTTDVDDHVSKLFVFDFEQSGIHLEESNRKRVAALNESILGIGQLFLRGTQDPRSIPKSELPPSLANHFSIEGDNIVISSLISDSPVEITRELAYRIYLHPHELQELRLRQLVDQRHEMAVLCGFDSYAQRATRGSLAETPQLVNSFLTQLSDTIKCEAKDEFDEMARMKRELSSNSSKDVFPWDVHFLTNVARKKLISVPGNENIASYFPLGSVMDGLSDLLTELFDIRLKVEVTNPGEVWSDDVHKVAVIDGNDGILGHIYCDFFERHQKPHQDCHFTIKGGKQLSDGTYQNPVVVVLLNLPSPSWSRPSLLSLSMVENLFHEMGHAMHSMLARTKYQHVTGTRCTTDFAEVPSILFEYFANDARVLHRMGRHYKTGERVPMEMLKNVLASKNVFGTIEMQLQTFYSLYDQRLHSGDLWGSEKSTSNLLEDVQNEAYGLPFVPNTAWQLRFGHLVGYGAKYYSYLMSRAVASWIWMQNFEENPYNRQSGRRLLQEVLCHGGGKPPKMMVAEFLGKEITSENLVNALVGDLCRKKSINGNWSKN